MRQTEYDVTRHGINVDVNRIEIDHLGGTPIWLVR